MVRDGIPFVLVPLILALLLGLAGYWLGAWGWFAGALAGLSVSAFMAYFFRDPQREVPQGEGLIVSPADGRVTRVETLQGSETVGAPTLLSIFLSPLDVHINRAPIEGRVRDVTYTKGKYLPATREDSSLLNEQNTLTLEGENVTLVCRQIAGILARRIVCWTKAGETLARGERFGLIKFSSRTDVILPSNVEVCVRVGMRVQGGVTIIGKVRP